MSGRLRVCGAPAGRPASRNDQPLGRCADTPVGAPVCAARSFERPPCITRQLQARSPCAYLRVVNQLDR
jgi:hypothetical protein